MRSLLRSLKHLPLAVAVTLITHPALAQINLGQGRVGGGEDDIFKLGARLLDGFSSGAKTIGGSIIMLSAVVLGIKIVFAQGMRWETVGYILLGGIIIVGSGHIASMFGL